MCVSDVASSCLVATIGLRGSDYPRESLVRGLKSFADFKGEGLTDIRRCVVAFFNVIKTDTFWGPESGLHEIHKTVSLSAKCTYVIRLQRLTQTGPCI